MLLKNNNFTQIDYLKDWPGHYYEIPTAIWRKEILEAAESQGLLVSDDTYRKKFCEKRFFTRNREGTVDLFMYAWMMIKTAGEIGAPLFGRKKIKKELESYMENLCLTDYEIAWQAEQAVLIDEWRDFARSLIKSCVESRNYRLPFLWWNTYMRFNDSDVAEKIAAEIFLVTRDYPSLFGLETQFAPLRKVMCETYCQMIENAEDYLGRFGQL